MTNWGKQGNCGLLLAGRNQPRPAALLQTNGGGVDWHCPSWGKSQVSEEGSSYVFYWGGGRDRQGGDPLLYDCGLTVTSPSAHTQGGASSPCTSSQPCSSHSLVTWVLWSILDSSPCCHILQCEVIWGDADVYPRGFTLRKSK